MSVHFYEYIVKYIQVIHWIVIILNISAIVMLLVKSEWYIAVPVITCLTLVQDTHCIFNRIENYFRRKALMPLKKEV